MCLQWSDAITDRQGSITSPFVWNVFETKYGWPRTRTCQVAKVVVSFSVSIR